MNNIDNIDKATDSGLIPANCLHTPSHEWLQPLSNGNYHVGISDAGQAMLGDIVFCGEALVGQTLKAGETCAVVESVKAASDVHMPIDGTILAFNTALTDDPTALNTHAYGTWILTIAPTHTADAGLATLMSPAAYSQQL